MSTAKTIANRLKNAFRLKTLHFNEKAKNTPFLTAKQITALRPQWTKEMLIKIAGCDSRRLDEPTYRLDRIIKLEESEEFKNWRKI